MPTKKQIDNNRDLINFSSVLGGNYSNGNLYTKGTRGYWYGSDTSNSGRRYGLDYNGSKLDTNIYARVNGVYIRCVSEEKTVLDLTYMQDMMG